MIFLKLNPRGQSSRDEWRNVVKKIREKLASLMTARRTRAARWLKPALILAVGLAASLAGAAPTNDNFASAITLRGASGSTNGNNTSATLETCETNALITDNPAFNPDPIANSVWFKWTAPASGTLELDTAGSAFNTVLAVWTTVGGLCDASLTNLISNDSFTSADQHTAQVNFHVVVGKTYYISVNSFDDGTPGDNVGAYVLNWNASFPSLSSGSFKFTQGTYTVSQSDSTAPLNPDGGTVGPSVPAFHPELVGARLTVTRPPPAYGRVSVDYAVTAQTYQNTFTTNYFGTNIVVLFADTNLPPIISATNNYVTNIVVSSSYQSYARGFQTATLYYGTTNTASEVFSGISAGTTPVSSGPLSPTPANLPYLTNYTVVGNVTAGGFQRSFVTNFFGFLQSGVRVRGPNSANGSTYTNGSGFVYTNFATVFTNNYITNFYGTNITITFTSTAFNGPYFRTNYYYTNIVTGYIYSTNSIYINGLFSTNLLVSGTNWGSPGDTANMASSYLNSTNYARTFAGSPLVPIPVPTNIPPLGSFVLGFSDNFDSSGNEIISQTNFFSYALTSNPTVPSANGITLATGTIPFANFQMSADILVPVSEAGGPDAPVVANIPGLATITLSNPQLDPQEDANLIIAPTIAGATAQINALSRNYGTGADPNYSIGPGIFNLERSYFIVRKNVAGSNAVVSVYRGGTNVQDAVTVDYTIDPARTTTFPFGMTPPNGNFLTTQDGAIAQQSFINGQANTFVLEAGSDYATPGSDFIITNGTLSWGAFDVAPKQITIPILNNGLLENNEDLLIQLHNPLPIPATALPGNTLGEVNSANLTILFDDASVAGGQFPGQQPAGAADRTWNKNGATDSVPPNLLYPGTTPGNGGTVYAVAEQPDGRAIIAGSFISYDSTPYNRIVRVLSNGYQDPTFQGNRSDLGNNSGANDFIAALALQPDGQIIIGGID